MQAAGGIGAIGIAVLLMLPPTKPVTAAPTPHTFGKVQPPAPLDAVYPDYAPLPPAPSVDPAADAARSPPQPQPDEYYASRTASPTERVADPGSQFYAGADSDADFDRGYRWAAARALEDPNRCMRWPDAPQVEGCLAYIRDAAGREDSADPEDRYSSDEEQ